MEQCLDIFYEEECTDREKNNDEQKRAGVLQAECLPRRDAFEASRGRNSRSGIYE